MISVADKRRATDDELERMHLTNGDGAGIAWREKSNPKFEHDDLVKWEKNLTLEEIKVYNAQVPLPYVLHFRIASSGGKAPELCHPFPVEKQMRPALSGETKGSVLFHNGTWGSWREKGIDGAIHNNVRVPEGAWSDTRVMAWLAHLHGPGILNLIDEKVILFSPTRIEIFHIDGWFRVDDLLVSNRLWEHARRPVPQHEDYSYMHGGQGWQGVKICRSNTCANDALAGTWYCAEHQPDCRQYDCRIPRIAGTEFCEKHQPLCKTIGCNKPRQVGEQFCADHKILPIPAVQSQALVPVCLTDPGLQEQSRWARAINPKAYRANGQATIPVM